MTYSSPAKEEKLICETYRKRRCTVSTPVILPWRTVLNKSPQTSSASMKRKWSRMSIGWSLEGPGNERAIYAPRLNPGMTVRPRREPCGSEEEYDNELWLASFHAGSQSVTGTIWQPPAVRSNGATGLCATRPWTRRKRIFERKRGLLHGKPWPDQVALCSVPRGAKGFSKGDRQQHPRLRGLPGKQAIHQYGQPDDRQSCRPHPGRL